MYEHYFGFRVPPFSVTPDPDFFYGNTVYHEAFASLEYGVRGKKGFIIATGEVGTGKTTLLRKLLRSLGTSVQSIFIFNTQINFDDLLRLSLDDLGLPRTSDDRSTLIETLNEFLIARLNEGRITCLFIDEAQNLSAETLEGVRLLSNLETDKEKLLQIVLVGQPELEDKIEKPALRQLKQRVVLHCRLRPLEKKEVPSYIDCRLKVAGYDGNDLFSAAAVEQIAAYSDGVPRVINTICDNALLTAYALSQKRISAEIIKEVATDLRLSVPEQIAPSTIDSGSWEKQKEISPIIAPNAVPGKVWEWRSRDQPLRSPSSAPTGLRQRSQSGLRIGALLTLLVFGGAGAFMYSQPGRKYLSHVAFSLEDLWEQSSSDKLPPSTAEPTSPRNTSETQPTPSPEQSTTTHGKVTLGSPPVTNNTTVASPEKLSAAAPHATAHDIEREKQIVSKRRSSSEISEDPRVAKRKLELAVEKAIQNRAIMGVSVSFTDGVTYLDGEVATERQKAMAERAARSIAKVHQVRNRLRIRRVSELDYSQ